MDAITQAPSHYAHGAMDYSHLGTSDYYTPFHLEKGKKVWWPI